MFNKRESSEGNETRTADTSEFKSEPSRTASGRVATIGPTVRIEGRLESEEDIVLEGRVKGTVSLKKNTLTIGTNGTLEAEVFAHTILVDGTVNGDLYASERLNIRKSARINGNIYAPRISLEDGARFRGSIDMDADSEPFRKAFDGKSGKAAAEFSPARPSGPQPAEPKKTYAGGSSTSSPGGNKQSSGAAG